MDAPPHNTQEQWSREITINSYSADQDGNGRHTSEADEPGMEDVQERFERERRSWKEKEMVYEERIEELERRQRLSEQEFKVRIGRLEADLALRTHTLAASVTAAEDLLAGKGGVTLEGADDIEELAVSWRCWIDAEDITDVYSGSRHPLDSRSNSSQKSLVFSPEITTTPLSSLSRMLPERCFPCWCRHSTRRCSGAKP
jgi:hypothetical protein